MRRYYSHYTFIYPSTYLKNHIVEMDSANHITSVFPFTEEIEKTEFYSGLLIFSSKANEKAWNEYPTDTDRWEKFSNIENFSLTDTEYSVIYEGVRLR